VRGRRQISDVACQGAEIAGVVRDAFELEGDPAQHLRARRDSVSGESFEGLAMGRRVPHRPLARERLDVMDGPFRRPADELALDAAVLVSERDLEA
jgi:hypothetical protein